MAFEILEDRAAFERDRAQRILYLENGAFAGPELPEEWDYEPDPEDTFDVDGLDKYLKDLINVTPSVFTEFAIRMPNKEKQTYVPFDFSQRRYLRQIYDTPNKRTLLKCGRQVEKSTMLGNKLLSYSCIITA